MTSQGSNNTSDQSREQHPDAAPFNILSSWEKVFRAYMVKARLAKDVLKADVTLSFEAIILSAICLMLLVGLGLVIWVTLLVALGYGLVSLGAHWIFVPVTIIGVNLGLLSCIYSIFKSAKSSINLNATFGTVFDKD